MYLIHDTDNSNTQIWAVCEDYGQGPVWEFHVYGLMDSGDVRTCPSIDMAFELVGADPRPVLEIAPFLADH